MLQTFLPWLLIEMPLGNLAIVFARTTLYEIDTAYLLLRGFPPSFQSTKLLWAGASAGLSIRVGERCCIHICELTTI